MLQVVRTDAVSKAVATLIKSNGSKFFGVTFIKKDGTERKLTGHIRSVDGHKGDNTTKHFEKYVTVVLAQKDANGKEQFRNVNMETIQSVRMGGREIKFS
jgi:hypothetical protein